MQTLETSSMPSTSADLKKVNTLNVFALLSSFGKLLLKMYDPQSNVVRYHEDEGQDEGALGDENCHGTQWGYSYGKAFRRSGYRISHRTGKQRLNVLDGVKTLNIDMAELEDISSAGLRMLFAAQKVMNCQGHLLICHASCNVMKVLDATGIRDFFDFQIKCYGCCKAGLPKEGLFCVSGRQARGAVWER